MLSKFKRVLIGALIGPACFMQMALFGIDDALLATIALITSAVSGGAAAVSSSQASHKARKAQDAQRQQQNLRAAQERRQAIREGRMAFAQAEQNAENAGVAEGSSQGGRGSITSQMDANLAFLDKSHRLSNQAGHWMDQASNLSAKADMWGSFSKLALTGYQAIPGPADAVAKLPKVARPPGGLTNGQFSTSTFGNSNIYR